MKILVTGATGQLGYDVCKVLAERKIEYVGISTATCDITDDHQVKELFETMQPDGVIHCAAYTKVDQAEEEPEKCWEINVEGTKNIASACRRSNIKMIYISTDYVFPGDGEKYYETNDRFAPCNTYGASKLAGELAVKALLERYFIVRVSWVFGSNGGNFVKTMLKLAETQNELNVVCDQIGSPTYTVDLAPVLCDMIETECYGTFHATNEGICSWAEFAQTIFRLTEKDTIVHPIPTKDYPTKAVRPLNSRMSKTTLDKAGFNRLPHWEDALNRYLKENLK